MRSTPSSTVSFIRARRVGPNGLTPVLGEHNGRLRPSCILDVIRYSEEDRCFLFQGFLLGIGRNGMVSRSTLPVDAIQEAPIAECLYSKKSGQNSAIQFGQPDGRTMVTPHDRKALAWIQRKFGDALEPGYVAEDFSTPQFWVRLGEIVVKGMRFSKTGREMAEYYWSPEMHSATETAGLCRNLGFEGRDVNEALSLFLKDRFGDADDWDQFVPSYMVKKVSNAVLFADLSGLEDWQPVTTASLNQARTAEDRKNKLFGGLNLLMKDADFVANLNRFRQNRDNKTLAAQRAQEALAAREHAEDMAKAEEAFMEHPAEVCASTPTPDATVADATG